MGGAIEPLDQFEDLSWLEPDPSVRPDDPVEEIDSLRPAAALDSPEPADELDSPEPAMGLSITSPSSEADDDVHFGVAARALGVSRKTVERMVKRGQLERGPSGTPATVSKRALVAELEQRRRDVSHLTRATAIEHAKSGSEGLGTTPSPDATQELRELLLPVLAPLLDEFLSVRTHAAVLESQLENVKAGVEQQRARDELLYALATKGWWGRRKARRAVLRHYVLGEGPSAPGPNPD
jgi:hypothetical protein